jgi:hypothetical protein
VQWNCYSVRSVAGLSAFGVHFLWSEPKPCINVYFFYWFKVSQFYVSPHTFGPYTVKVPSVQAQSVQVPSVQVPSVQVPSVPQCRVHVYSFVEFQLYQ